jgi:hypothetical protein
MMNAPRWRRWLFALLIFLGGAACGAGVSVVVVARIAHHVLMHPEEAPRRIATRLSHRLDLSKEQTAQVEQIIRNRQGGIGEIRRDMQPRIETQLTQLESDIAGVLTPPQQQKWHALVATLRSNWLPPVPTASTTPSTSP